MDMQDIPAAIRGIGAGPPAAADVLANIGSGHLSGTLAADPQLHHTADLQARCTVQLTRTTRIMDCQTGQWGDIVTQTYDVIMLGDLARNIASRAIAGDRLLAWGTWRRRTSITPDGLVSERRELLARDAGFSMRFAARSSPASCGHPRNEDGECNCSAWPERAAYLPEREGG